VSDILRFLRGCSDALFQSAADEIDRLRAENDALLKRVSEYERDFVATCSLHAHANLLTENAALLKDAERYRWLRGTTKRVCHTHVEANILHAKGLGQPEAVDAAIDAALEKP